MELPYKDKDKKLLDNITYCYHTQFFMDHNPGQGPVIASYNWLSSLYQSMMILHGEPIDQFTPSRFLEKMVSAVEEAPKNNKVLMFSFYHHCVLVTDYYYNKYTKEHVLTLYDENTAGKDDMKPEVRKTQMVLSENCDKAKFEVNSGSYSFSDLSSQIYSNVKNMALIDPSKIDYYGRTQGRSMSLSGSEDKAVIEYPEGYEFTITNKEGKYLNIRNNEDDLGDMQILGVNSVITDRRNIVRIEVPASSWFCVTNADGISYSSYDYDNTMETSEANLIRGQEKMLSINIINRGKYMSLDTTSIDKAYFYGDDNTIKVIPADTSFDFDAAVQVEDDGDEDIAMTLTGTSSEEFSIKADDAGCIPFPEYQYGSFRG